MNSESTFLAAPRSLRWWAAAGVLIAVAAAAAAAGAAFGGDAPQAAPHAPAGPATAVTSAPGLDPDGVIDASAVPEDGVLQLVRGSRTVKGISVGYPHTTVGAISAAVEFTTVSGANLDLVRAETIGATITDGTFGGPAAFHAGPIDGRRRLGVATTGAVPAGVSMISAVNAYQLRGTSKDAVTVLLLGYLTLTSPATGMRVYLTVVPADMVWHDGDWKLTKVAHEAADFDAIRVRPGSPEASRAGWQDFVQ